MLQGGGHCALFRLSQPLGGRIIGEGDVLQSDAGKLAFIERRHLVQGLCFRRILRDLIPTPYELSVYGTNWHGLIDEKYIKGEYLPNETLGRDYRDAAILLNDHWEDMRQKGFISNRIFDALSAGAFMISDEIEGLEDVLAGCVVTYKDREDLAEKVRFYMEHPAEREKIAARGMALVREKHTFRARADELLRFLEERRRSLPPAEKDGERA